MTASSQRAALDAVHSARPIVARLSADRHKEDLAADILDAWTAVETGLRSLIGGSTLAGQALIRELRQRHFLSLEQANSLAEFNAARERSARTDYTPTEGDVNAVRDAFLKLEAGLMGEPTAPVVSTVPPPPAATAVPIGDGDYLVAQPTRSNPLKLVLGIVGVLAAVGLVWWLVARGGSGGHSASYDEGVKAYAEGRREAAEGAFRKAETDTPKDAMPHVYLSRIERERGNINNANVEAVRAVELEGTNAIALRELASVRFAQGDYEGARKFYVRAITADPTDRVAQGYLSCTLIRMGRVDEGNKWATRAGTGPWSGCVPAAGATAQPGTTPTGNPAVPMTVPRP
jgi:tetratricopeptide (TPR) repeat protein